MDQPPTTPSTPDPAVVTLVASLLRHILTALAGAGFLGGLAINDGMLMTAASSLVGIATIGWALYDKVVTQRRDHLGSVLSAKSGVAVQPAG